LEKIKNTQEKVSFDGGALLAPLPPVMVSVGTMEDSNILTVAWTGIINTTPSKTYISVRKSRHSHAIIKETGEFVINLTTASLVKSADFCGIHTGRKVDKFKKCALTKEKAKKVSCPCIAESPLNIECIVKDIIEFESHDMFIADIVNINVNRSLINSNNKICLDKANLAAFAHGEYFSLGKKIGTFGFSVKKKKKHLKK